RDRGVKLERYRHFGVPEYWIVDPSDRSVSVWRFAEKASYPVIVRSGDVLSWQPQPRDEEHGGQSAAPPLELEVESLFAT
ncbi:MAG: Uma2 family endonuclease, partial [Gemmatimonadetes bacterium]|nr:Uma2 family endonuclease [Gemmatimonadota bacterium]